MTYLFRKINELRSMFEEHNPTDEELVSFMQELAGVGYGDGEEAASILDGLPEIYEVWWNNRPAMTSFGPWGEHRFASLDKAAEYASWFLGNDSPGITFLAANALDNKYVYDKDTIEIRRVTK